MEKTRSQGGAWGAPACTDLKEQPEHRSARGNQGVGAGPRAGVMGQSILWGNHRRKIGISEAEGIGHCLWSLCASRLPWKQVGFQLFGVASKCQQLEE